MFQTLACLQCGNYEEAEYFRRNLSFMTESKAIAGKKEELQNAGAGGRGGFHQGWALLPLRGPCHAMFEQQACRDGPHSHGLKRNT